MKKCRARTQKVLTNDYELADDFCLLQKKSLQKHHIIFLTDSTEQVGISSPSAGFLSQEPLKKSLLQQ